jgi:BirA family biotin operon repressor/biotin-[acetyl-CoA-carboxylase] ligase
MPVRVGGGWRVEVVPSTGSTNADVAARARAGEAPGLVIVAEAQTAGRGRLDRSWVSPPRAGLTFSVLLSAPPSPWVPLLGGVAVVQGLAALDVTAELKWPNDVQVGGRKLAGLLAEVVATPDGSSRVVLGVGLNVSTRAEELPVGRAATSLALLGASTDRLTILRALLRALAGPATPADYRDRCATLGAPVRLELPDGRYVEGRAEAVDDDGHLVVAGVAYAAADVIHLR